MRIKIEFAYDGRDFFGFQTLPEKRTVQNEVEKVLSKILNEDIKIIASGRTDAGVSANLQVAHFDTTSTIVPTNIAFAANKILPNDIRIFSSKKVSENFHARFSAKEKTYKYLFYFGEVNNPVLDIIACYVGKSIDLDKMKNASKYFVGKHDFTSFSTLDKEVKNHVREIKSIEIKKIGDIFELKITGNSFLWNMVRIIAGTLFEVGTGTKQASEINDIFAKKNRKYAGKLMPAEFLVLDNVKYWHKF